MAEGARAMAATSCKAAMSYHAGLAAEDRISRDYERRGFSIAQRRWRGRGRGPGRGRGGEIDLVARGDDGLIFVEVKQSRDFETAIQHLSPRQMQRLYNSAEEYLGTMPNGSLTDVRFDVALVNGFGEMQIIENAFGHG